jgi:hypothetical protein
MPQKINLNVPPYNDDFDTNKNYYKVLFRPGYSIQARELTNLQSILQNQIESIGRSRFKQGQQVIPGEVSFNRKVDYVKLASVSEVAVNINGNIVFQKYDISNLIGVTLQGLTSGVTASVISYAFGNDVESDVLFVKYTNSGNANNESTFRQGETLEALNIADTPTLVVGTDGSVLPTTIDILDYDTGVTTTIDSPAMGYASAVKVESGVYFINGYFVNNAEELIIVDKYYDKPSVKVGFNIIEEILTPEEDQTLYDNAKGFSNFSAPGAHRLSISLKLVVNELNALNDVDYVQLVTIKNGEIQQLVKQADFNLIEETLARRTYDESGDYVVDNFSLDLREYYQRDNNKGIYPLNEDTELVNGKSPSEAKSLMVAGVGSGKAYIKGYEVVNKDTKYITLNKARETLVKEDTRVKSGSLSYFNVTNVYGSVPLNAEGQDLTAYPTLYLNNAFNDGSIGFNNTEDTTAVKQTLSRRGQTYSLNDGIITITLANPGAYASRTFPTNAEFGSSLTELWYVVNFGTTPATTTVNKVDLLSYSIIKRPLDLDSNTAVQFLELTVKGNKEELYYFLREYDEADPAKRRKLFVSRSDAQGYYFQQGTPTIFPYSEIFDYNDVITPVVGVAKPKDFSLIEKGTGFNNDLDVVLSKGRITNGSTTYNSIFRLAYFNPNYFTKITVDSDLNSNIFKPGKYIVGSSSGAYAVIEGSSTTKYTVGNSLFVKLLSGEFLPGETITDEEGNSRRIARDGTISHFIVLKRGEGYPVTTQLKINGVTYSSSAIDIKYQASGIYRVSIKDRNLVGQVYSTPPSISFDTGNNDATSEAIILPVLYRNTVYTYNSQNIKSIDCAFGSGNAYRFTCDVESFGSSYVRTKILTDFTFSGKKGVKFLECNGFSGDPSNDLSQGDIIQYTDINNVAVRNIVLRVDKAEGLIKSRIFIDNVLSEDVSNANVVKVSPVVSNSSSSSLLIPTGAKYVETIVQDPDDSGIKYNFRRDFVTVASTSGGSITFAAQLPYGTQRFVSFTESNFLLTVLSKRSATTYNGLSGGVPVNSGDIIYLKSDQVQISNSIDSASGLTAGSVSINLPSTFFGTDTDFPILKLSATVEVSKARPRLKTVNRNKRILIVSPGDRVVALRGLDYDSNSTDILSYSDVFKIRYIYEGTLQTPPVVSASGELVTGTDVTERFSFDDGQRDTFYDVSRLILKPGFTPPVGQLIVCFDYFEHSQGDFCTVDSYLHEAGVEIDEIPSFNSVVYGNTSLRDVFDFRPKVDSKSIITGYQDTSLLSVTDFNSFTGSAGITSSTPATEQNLEFTVSFTSKQYLDRIDGVFLNKKGEFFVKEGNASLNPTKPTDVDDSLALYYMYIPAYTTTPNDVKIIPVDNRRYTMRDIGKLEKRIERLEQYTLLSVLEQQALNMQVKDDIGIDRFKSGFIVDNFENHAVGNLGSIDYKCAIDTQQSTLRPRSSESSFILREIQERDEQRTLNAYKKTGDIITLPYTSISAISNNFATKTLSVNPFVVGQYVGEIKLSPNIDQWFDDTEKPLILDNDSKVFSVFYAKNDSREGFSSLHNNYIVNWIGTNRVFFNINTLTDISSISSSATTSLASTASSSNISPQNNQLAQSVPTKTQGSNTVVSSLQLFCRSVPVFFTVTRMKPKSKLFAFIDGKNVDRWIAQDFRFTGIAGNSLSTFGQGLTTDENGNASGLLIFPSGVPPQVNTEWTGDVKTVQYDTTASPLSFIAGNKTVRFTSDSNGLTDSTVDSFTQTTFFVTGSLPNQPSTIISTSPAIFKGEEGIQYVDNTKATTTPNPLSQSFLIEKYPGGVFLTGLDLYFSKKSSTIPIKVYLTNIESGKPGKYIVPGSECVLNPNTYLRVYTNGTLYVTKGETVTGTSSGASGPIKSIIDKNNVEIVPSVTGVFTLTNDQVYTLVLDNHNGKTFIQNETLSIPSLVTYNAANATQLNVTIAKNSGRITALEISNCGTGYESAQLTIESPQLIGGINATASCLVSSGKIYDVSLNVKGSGYTEAPSVIIKGTGLQAANASIKAILTIDTPAVRMGVAVDPGTTAVTDSTTPTRFNFEYPVYLQNNTEYAFAVESDSTDYVIWASKLGENEISTNSVVTSQPLLGSVFKSQNVDTWSEDLFEDIKFTLYRAEFDISRTGIVELTNETLGYELLDSTPFETDSLSDTTSTSTLFKNNNKIIKVIHKNNGFEDSGKSYVSFKNCADVGGISSETLNTTLFKIDNCGSDFYTINPEVRASSNDVGGGSKVLSTYNRKYEKLFAQVAYLNFSDTQLDAEVKTVNIIPFDSGVTNYNTYSQTGFEKTFLNEDHYFNNQKVLASRINELVNSDTINQRSLIYKLSLSSSVSYLSPVIDLRSCSVKLVNNYVEKSKGDEKRFGRRDQIIKFYPIYKFTVTGTGANTINFGDAANPKIVTGNTSKAQAILLKLDQATGEIYVKMLTDTLFVPSENLVFVSQGSLTELFVSSSGIEDVLINFPYNSVISAIDKTDVTKSYTNVISGRVVLWDAEKRELRISNNKNPINNNYTAAATTGSDYARSPFTSDLDQVPDIFRVGDFITYENQPSDTKNYLEIKSVDYSSGILFVPEISKNSSSIAKYITKEISLETPSTGLDVKLTANVFEEDDILVLYKIKPASSQFNFDDLGWQYFNETGIPDVRVIPSSNNTIAGYIEEQASYKEYKYSISNLSDFTSFAIKIVMRSSNPVFVPKIQDIRVVASFG